MHCKVWHCHFVVTLVIQIVLNHRLPSLYFFNIASLCGHHFSLATHAPPTLCTGGLEHFVFIIHLFIYFANLLIFSTFYLVTVLFWLRPFSLCSVRTMSADFVFALAPFGNGSSSAMHSTFPSHCRCWPVWSSNTWSSCQTSVSLRPDFVSAAYSGRRGKMGLTGLLRPQGQRWERLTEVLNAAVHYGNQLSPSHASLDSWIWP